MKRLSPLDFSMFLSALVCLTLTACNTVDPESELDPPPVVEPGEGPLSKLIVQVTSSDHQFGASSIAGRPTTTLYMSIKAKNVGEKKLFVFHCGLRLGLASLFFGEGDDWEFAYAPACEAFFVPPLELAVGDSVEIDFPFEGFDNPGTLPRFENGAQPGLYRLELDVMEDWEGIGTGRFVSDEMRRTKAFQVN